MSVKAEKAPSKSRAIPTPTVRYMDKITFRAAKKRVFAKHAELLSKLAK
jgi:hypothetical protein